jgi:hypothetical protein
MYIRTAAAKSSKDIRENFRQPAFRVCRFQCHHIRYYLPAEETRTISGGARTLPDGKHIEPHQINIF